MAYAVGDDQRAFEQISQADHETANIVRALLLADRDPEAAMAIFREVEEAKRPDRVISAFDLSVPLLCGKPESVARIAATSLSTEIPVADEQWKTHLKFLAGEMAEKEFVSNSVLGWRQAGAYCLAGLKHLAAGDRAGGLNCFSEADARFTPGHPPSYLARAFLKRMESDEQWPRSITQRSGSE
jgi:hypothetical protein